jgi:hypothetical protein
LVARLANVINPEGIDAFLAGFFPDNLVAARHLQTALHQALKKEAEALQPVAATSQGPAAMPTAI